MRDEQSPQHLQDTPNLDDLADAADVYVDPKRRRIRAQVKTQRKKVSNGRVALLAVSFLSAIGCGLYLLIWLGTQEFTYAIDSAVYGALASAFAGLYIWARRSAYPALLTGICAFSALWLLDIIVALLTEPSNVMSGAIGRAVILFFLIIGLRTAYARKQNPRSV